MPGGVSHRPQPLPIRVAVADDDPLMLDAVADLLRADPAIEIVGLAKDAVEAIEMIAATAPHVALIDVRMPGGGGVAVARALAEEPEAPRLIAFSASSDRDAVTMMLAAGAVGYLIKGGPTDEIISAVHRASRGESTLSPAAGGRLIGAFVERVHEDERLEQVAGAARDRITQVLEGDGLDVAFQPIVALGDLSPLGFEALARFRLEPRQGPAEWFADATEAGLGVELELRAVEVALRAARALPEGGAGPRPFLSINASPATVRAERFGELLRGHREHPIVVEVTEHASVGDYEEFGQAVGALRAEGARLAIDDAGAGFASLRHILYLEPDIIKLDLALTRDVDTDPSRRAMVRALVAFSKERGEMVIAEGIETEGELAALRALAVPAGQGFHLGRPKILDRAG